MQFGWPQLQKPFRGATLDRTGALARGLLGFYACNEGSGGSLLDATGNLPMSAYGFGASNPWGSGPSGIGLNCSAAGEGAYATLPTQLQVSWPITIAVAMRPLGTPDSNANYFGLVANNSDSSPYEVLEINYNASNTYNLDYNAGGGFAFVSFGSWSAGVDTVIAATMTPTSIAGYQAGVPKYSSGGTYASPTYSATAQLAIGNYAGTSRNPNTLFYWAAWWDRALSAAEHAAIGSSPNAIWSQLYPPGPLRSWVFFQGSGSTFTGQSTGGVVMGGLFSPSVTFSPAASGGPVAGGSASPSTVFSGQSTGGAVVGGSAQGSMPASGVGLWWQRWMQKPPRGVPIDHTHPLSRGLVSFFPMAEGGGVPFDVAARVAATANTGAWSSSPVGLSLALNGTSQSVNIANSVALPTAGPVTVAAYCAPASGQTNQHVLDCRGTSHGYYLAFDSNSNGEIDWFTLDATTLCASSSSAVDGGWHTFAVTQSSSSSGGVQFYRDGQPWGTSTLTITSAVPPTATRVIGQNGSSSGWFKGGIGWVMVWNRALTAAEHAQLAANPWRVMSPWLIAATGNAVLMGQSSGGAVVGGLATPSAIFSGQSSGGAVVGGSASPSVILVGVSSGGPVVGGLATPSAIFAGASAGGAVLGGSAQGSKPGVFVGQSSGGTVLGGLASPSAIFAGQSSGGAVLGGSTQGHTTAVFVGQSSGGAVLGGSASGFIPNAFLIFVDPTAVTLIASGEVSDVDPTAMTIIDTPSIDSDIDPTAVTIIDTPSADSDIDPTQVTIIQ